LSIILRMTTNGSVKPGRKNRIAAYASNINLILFLLVLALMTAFSVVVINGIGNDYSGNLVRAYSIEASQTFYSYISQDLTLLQKASRSMGIANWFADETDEAKKSVAFEEMMVYADVLQGANFFFGIQESQNEYAMIGRIALEDFIPTDRMDSSNPDDSWYFECTNSENEYTLNNDFEKFFNTWCLWINHKVRLDGNLVGVICSGMKIPDLYQKIFSKYDTREIRGYIINKQGIIQTDNTVNPDYYMGKLSNIIDEGIDPAFAVAIGEHLGRINGFFGDLIEPVVVKLSKGHYDYASISPISNTDWSVVILFHDNTFSGIKNLIPLVLVMFAAFFLYVAGGNALMNKVVFTPLGRLTQEISGGKQTGKDFYGSDRSDEIGQLAKTIHSSIDGQRHQRQLLDAVNTVAAVLLSTSSKDNFEVSLQKGMGLIGSCLDVDRVYIWQNEKKGGELFFIKKFEWANNAGLDYSPVPIDTFFPYSSNPEWEKTFSQGKYLNGPLHTLSQNSRNFLADFGIKSILMIPLFQQEQFWGFVGFDDCHNDRFFFDDEINILRSLGLMMVSAMNRNVQARQLLQAHKRTQILLDAMPLSCQLWTKDARLFDCNEEAVKLFKVRDKQDFINRFWELSPEYQEDGELSYEKAMLYIDKAFSEGRVVFEWMHQIHDGAKIPAEVTAVRLKFEEEDIVAVYARDLREYKQMMREIDNRDYLLNTVNNVAAILLQSETGDFENGLHHCMGMLADAVKADRVYIWKNQIKDGQLYCTQIFEWSECVEPQQGKEITVDISYSENMPGWEENLSKGYCIHTFVSNMSPQEQAQLSPQGIMSIFIIPIFVQNDFWGFIGYDDCHRERLFSQDEQSILHSASMLIASSWLRNEISLDIRATADKLEAVIANYSGVIWCVDQNNKVTLFNGRYLNEQGFDHENFENRDMGDALQDIRFFSVSDSVRKTFSLGSQDLNYAVNDRMYSIRTTPIYDESGNVISIMGSFDDVTDRTRLQLELKEALEEAQNANSAKSNFLARMSHEMRTPLNAIIGLSELTLSASNLDVESSANLGKINNAGITLLSTVNHILDISKIEAGKFELVPVEYNFPSMLNDAITQSIIYKDEKPVKFTLDIDDKFPATLYGDDLRIKQILNNLLSNAFKYTKEGRVELSITCSTENSAMAWICISIRDTGIGIKSNDLMDVFTDYAQMDLSNNRRIEGTGLGLPITKKIVEMMDGSITVESKYGKGSVFTARFRQKVIGTAVIGSEVADNLKNFHYSDQKRHQASRMMRINLNYARVLVVDDVETNLDVAKGMLKPYGMKVDCLTSGREAINAIRSEKVRYNAIFMDHMMPEMDGIEATRVIREEIGTEYARTVPIIALTANAIMGNEEIFLQNGFQAFISKPIEIERLDAVIREFVRDKELERTFTEIDVNGKMLPNVRSGDERRNIADRRSGIDRRILGGKINGINYEKGIQRFNGDEESYLNVLRSYASNMKPLIDSVRQITWENLAKYSITLHGIKGASRGICAEQVGVKAEALEKAAKSGNMDFIMCSNAAFIEDAEKLVKDLEEMFKVIDIGNPKPKKDIIDPEVLKKLAVACGKYDMDGVDSAMEEIEVFEYSSDSELVRWLRENVNEVNFTQIKDKLGYTDYGIN